MRRVKYFAVRAKYQLNEFPFEKNGTIISASFLILNI